MKLKYAFLNGALLISLMHAAHADVFKVQSGESIQASVQKAKPGDVVEVYPGLYKETVFIDKENITLRGVIQGGKWPVLDGGNKLNDGVIASGNGVIISKLWIKGYKGNSIMTQGANNYRVTDNVIEGGFYGIFPQFGKNGLVARNRITGVEDAGIYVGMSDNVDVVANELYGNVMGVESENSRTILIEGNFIYNNSSGVVATLIPGLPVKDARDVYIRGNFIVNNNLKNFAPPSSIAASVPVGVGVLVVGVKNVSVEGNLIRDNGSAAVVSSDLLTFGLASDPKVDPYPEGVRVLSNMLLNNGKKPQGGIAAVVRAAKLPSIDIFASGKERDSCIANRESLFEAGTKKWKECAPDATTASIKTAMLAEPVKAPPLTLEQKGRLTYLAVCTGCHAYNTQLHGPSIMSVKALYQGNVAELVKYVKNPVKKRSGFAEMPKQDYLGDEVLNEVAKYILNDLKN